MKYRGIILNIINLFSPDTFIKIRYIMNKKNENKNQLNIINNNNL